jgi:hypothetical protein
MLITTILLAAGILVYALYRKGDVKFNVTVLGANVSLEAKDDVGRKRGGQ